MKREEYIRANYVLPPVPSPSPSEVMRNPKEGDMLCFDGQAWRVARSGGWNYPVPLPEQWCNAKLKPNPAWYNGVDTLPGCEPPPKAKLPWPRDKVVPVNG